MKRTWVVLAGTGAALLALSGCLAIGPAGPYRDGQTVDLSISGYAPGAVVHLSECGPGQLPTQATGCEPTLSGQPTVRMDTTGGSAATFRVVAQKNGIPCTGYCTIAVTDGRTTQRTSMSFTNASFVATGNAFDSAVFLLHDHEHPLGGMGPGSAPSVYVTVRSLLATFTAPTPLQPREVAVSIPVPAGQAVAAVLYPRPGNLVGAAVTLFPPTPPADAVRVRYVNVTPVRLTTKLGHRIGPDLAPGAATTITLAAEPGVPDGAAPYAIGYQGRSGACTASAAPQLLRGHTYVLTVGAQQPGTGTSACPYKLNVIDSSVDHPVGVPPA